MRTNFQMEYENITMIAGNTVAFNVEAKDEDGNPIIADSADLVCKKDLNNDEILFHKSLEQGISQSDGILTIRIAPEDTREAIAGQYFYAFQIGVENDIFTLLSGTLSIEENVVY